MRKDAKEAASMEKELEDIRAKAITEAAKAADKKK